MVLHVIYTPNRSSGIQDKTRQYSNPVPGGGGIRKNFPRLLRIELNWAWNL